MKIFINHSNDSRVFGLTQALNHTDDLALWIPENPPIFDLLENHEADILILDDESIIKAHINFVKKEYPNIKIVRINGELDLDKKISDAIDLDISIPYLINEHLHIGGKVEEQFSTDLLIITDGLPEDEGDVLLRVIDTLGYKYRLKVYGNKTIKSPYYLGMLRQDEYKNVLASTKAMILFKEEWVYPCLANNIVPIGKNDKTAFTNIEELCILCEKVLNNQDSDIRAELSKVDLSSLTYTFFAEDLKRRLNV